MTEFESNLNDILVDTFNLILKYEEACLKAMSDSDLTITEIHTIEAIGKLGQRATVSSVAGALDVTLPTATVALQKLERKGFVDRVPCTEDRRRLIVTLTELGQRMDRAHTIFHKRMVKRVSHGFSEQEQAVLMQGMKKLSAFFREKVEAKKWV